MKQLLAALAILMGLQGFAITAHGMSHAEAVNISGSQRMLSQRMMKSYLMIGADVKTDVAKRQLDESVALFEERLAALTEYAPSDRIRDRLKEVHRIWSAHRVGVLSRPSRENIDALMAENLRLLTACNDVVLAIADHANIASAELVNISGRQRMLSQRIAKAYVAMYWNIDSEAVRKEFAEAIRLFDESLQFLRASPMNTAEVNVALDRVGSQWSFSQSGFRLDANGQFVPTVISVTTESILWKMNDITKMYELIMSGQQRNS